MRKRGTAALSIGLLATGAATTTALLNTESAGAATPHTAGRITHASQNTWKHALTVQGWSWDLSNKGRSVRLNVLVNGHFVKRITANQPSPRWNKKNGFTGKHGFYAKLHVKRRAHKITVFPVGQRSHGFTHGARHYAPPPGARIVDVARKYVGHARYVYGGSSPRGFDCSGYTKYAYAKAHVKALPHNSESQRHVNGMHREKRRSARRGDLVFWFGGSGGAYHVALYTGHGKQISAVDPQMGVRQQRVPKHNIEFMTMTH